MVFASHAAVGQGQDEVLSYGGCVIGAVVFDVGECLADETREYGTWADWLGVPRYVFSAVFGAVIARGLDYRETFQVFQPGFDLAKARQQRADHGKPEWFGEDDLYPGARPALARLRADGLRVGIAGNQTSRAGGLLRSLELPADMIATSDDGGCEAGPGVLPAHDRGLCPSIPAASCMWATGSITTSCPYLLRACGRRWSGGVRGRGFSGMTRMPAGCRTCGLIRWPSCPAGSRRLTLERAEGGLPVIPELGH